MSQSELTKKQLEDRFGESAKQIERYVQEGMPCTGTGRARRFPWPEVRTWRDERLRRLEREATERKLKPASDDEVAQAKIQQVIAESRLMQLQLAEREGRVVTVEHLTEVVGEIGERMRAVLINLPSNYLIHLERLGVAPADGQQVLEEIAERLTLALRGVADEVEAAADDDDDADCAA